MQAMLVGAAFQRKLYEILFDIYSLHTIREGYDKYSLKIY